MFKKIVLISSHEILGPDRIVYSVLKYEIGEEPPPLPIITCVMYQANGDDKKDYEVVDFSKFLIHLF